MDLDNSTCLCGRFFDRPAALSHHRRKCKRTKRQLLDVLSKARILWADKQAQKQKQTAVPRPDHQLPPQQPQVVPPPETLERPRNLSNPRPPTRLECEGSIAERRTRRTIRQPRRFDEMVPHPPSDDLSELDERSETATEPVEDVPVENETTSPVGESSQHMTAVPAEIYPILCLPKDQFGVFRQYYSISHARQDPDRRRAKGNDEDKDDSIVCDSRDCDFEMVDSGMVDSEMVDPETVDAECLTETVVEKEPLEAVYHPYPNKTSFLLAEWYWGRRQKSRHDFHKLLKIISHQEFDANDVRQTPWLKIDKLLGSSNREVWPEGTDASWIRERLEILVPFHRMESDEGSELYEIGYFFRRSLLSIIRETLSGPAGRLFHYDPVELFWLPPKGTRTRDHDDETPLRLFGELYNSPAFVDAYCDLQKSPREPQCTLPRSVIALMFSSDETHLTQFGETKLWPLYLCFGNISKYTRRKSGSRQCHHVAYFATLPDEFEEFVKGFTGKGPTDALFAFCNRETYHAQWKSILDNDFIEAYAHGFIFDCLDGQTRRLYPRIFTLSADYKEKSVKYSTLRVIWSQLSSRTSIVSIRHLGTHPCPRCMVKLDDVHNMGTDQDQQSRADNTRRDDDAYRNAIQKARKQIFKMRYAVKGSIDKILKPYSITPTESAFSSRLSTYGFDAFQASVVDLMHDIEQGTWPALFKHLLRILHCHDKTLIIELDTRYRCIPTFGRDTIRKFRKNISEMKGLAARDFEDILQAICSIPAFEGLIPEPHNARVIKLLFIMAEWHGLAKLRLHSTATLSHLDSVTTELGTAMREFKSLTCAAFDTEELPKEKEARYRRSKNAQSKNGGSLRADPGPSTDHVEQPVIDSATKPVAGGKVKKKEFSLRTYKFHAMGHYVENIQRYGTTDSYSTEMGELEHRQSKSRYSRTNKKDFVKQMTETERREARLHKIRQHMERSLSSDDRHFLQQDIEEGRSLNTRYHMSKTQSSTVHIFDLLRTHPNDSALKHFLSNLRTHCLVQVRRMLGLSLADSDDDLSVYVQHDRLYRHKVLRLNYTTYDLQREQDAINPDSPQCNIMVLQETTDDDEAHSPVTEAEGVSNSDSANKYLYAKALMIFHVNVICTGTAAPPGEIRLDVVWVRWYHHHPRMSGLPSPHLLDRLSFPPLSDPDAFGFVNPQDILRASHIIPAFDSGWRQGAETDDSRDLSVFAKDNDDWQVYYVNRWEYYWLSAADLAELGRFVDRDMLMRHYDGLGVGHVNLMNLQASSVRIPNQNIETDHQLESRTSESPNRTDVLQTDLFELEEELEEDLEDSDTVQTSEAESDRQSVNDPSEQSEEATQAYIMYPE